MVNHLEISHIFKALGDDTRIAIIGLLANSQRLRVSDIAMQFQMTRPGVAKHLTILERAGIIESEWVGREKYYILMKRPLSHAHRWLSKHHHLWQEQ